MVFLYWYAGAERPALKNGVVTMAIQLSFLDASGLLRPDCMCQFEIFCALCGGVLMPRKRAKKLYWLAGRPPRRICKACSTLYAKTFDERILAEKRGAKK